MSKSVLIVGFNIKQCKEIYNKVRSFSILPENQKNFIKEHLFEGYILFEDNSFFGSELASWNSFAENIDVKSDTIAYVARQLEENTRKILDIDISIIKKTIIGMSRER